MKKTKTRKTSVQNKKTPAKRATAKGQARVAIMKRSNTMSPFVHRLLLVVGVIAFGVLGAYLLRHPFAQDPHGVPRGADELVLEYIPAHVHETPIGEMPHFKAPHTMLFGDGLLLCGQDSPSPKKGYELNAGKLTASQIDELIGKITKTHPDSDSEKALTKRLSQSEPIEVLSQLLINYNQGGMEIRSRGGGEESASLNTSLSALKAACAKYAKTAYDPAEYVLSTQAVSEQAVADVDQIDSNVAASNDDGSFSQIIITRQDANDIKNANQGNNRAKTSRDGKTYAVEVSPTLPIHNGIDISVPQDDSVVEAASSLPSRWYWFYPADRSLSSLNTQTATISSSVRSFYKQVSGRDNSAAAPVVVKGLRNYSWYVACHSELGYSCTPPPEWGVPSGDKDYYAFKNIRWEFIDRDIVKDSNPNVAGLQINASYNILVQWQSWRGANWCYGYANQPASVASSYGEVGASFGYGSSSSGCQVQGDTRARYLTPAHEMGHTVGIGHICSSTTTNGLMEVCKRGSYTWPTGYSVTSTQQSQLKAYSLFLNHKISGRVYYEGTSTGVSGLKVTTCGSNPIPTTNSTGYFDLRLPTRGAYCLRITPPAGYSIKTKNNQDHAGSTTYEYQLAGYNCYNQPVSTSCTSAQVTWDMSTDSAKDFILVKNP